MNPAAHDVERHRAPALWVVLGAIGAACLAAVLLDAQLAAGVLTMTLVAAAGARIVGRGRRPEGIAVRAVWLDVVVLGALAVGIGVLMFAPGV